MSKQSKILQFLNRFSPREFTVVVFTFLICIPLVIFGFNITNNVKASETFSYAFSEGIIRNVNGDQIYSTFDTDFFVAYESNQSRAEFKRVKEITSEYLIKYHRILDRHNEYFEDLSINANAYNESQKHELEKLPRVKNLFNVNKNIGNETEVEKSLYDLLLLGQGLSLKSSGAFNMFVGALNDFWDPIMASYYNSDTKKDDFSKDPINNEKNKLELERLVSFLPKTNEEISDAITFREDIENDKYYVTLNSFNGAKSGELIITVGGIAKGYMTDVLKAKFEEENLIHGYINGGSSSITYLKDNYFGKPRQINMSTIDKSGISPAFSATRTGKYSISTSGTYMGKEIVDSNGDILIRSHIIDPNTGYPSTHSHRLASIISSTLSGTELEVISTSLIVLTKEEGVLMMEKSFAGNDLNYTYLSVDYTPLPKYTFTANAEYPGGSDKTLEIHQPYTRA